MTDTQEKLYTADDVLHMPADGTRRELIRGQLIEMSPANSLHGELAAKLLIMVGNYVYAHKLGRVYTAETGFNLFSDPDTVLAPDMAFLSVERAKPRAEKFGPVAPDLAAEVVSPSNAAAELNEKITLYFQAGTRQVWIVYPKTRMIHVYTAPKQIIILSGEDELDAGAVLPGFRLSLEELFSVLDTP